MGVGRRLPRLLRIWVAQDVHSGGSKRGVGRTGSPPKRRLSPPSAVGLQNFICT